MSPEEAVVPDPTHQYSRVEQPAYRIPTPPRIIIPPPSIYSDSIKIGHVHSSPDPRSDVSFLNFLDLSARVKRPTMLEWKYENRRQAQEVLPFLYLGPISAAKDVGFLQREEITMVLAIRHRSILAAKLLSSALRTAQEQGIANMSFDIADNTELIAQFPRIIQAMNEHLVEVRNRAMSNGLITRPVNPWDAMGRILIFCESGNERSAAVCAAYLMQMLEGVNYVAAMQVCQTQRFCVNFDDAMKYVLSSYWDIIVAKRMVGETPEVRATQQTRCSGLVNGRKRSLGRAFDDDDMELDMDEGRDRAPFQDFLPTLEQGWP